MLMFKQSGSSLPHLQWWRSHKISLKINVGLFYFKFISWFISSAWTAAQSSAVAASMKAGVPAGAGNGRAFLAPAQTSIALNWLWACTPVADGVNNLVTVPLSIYQLEKASTQLSSYRWSPTSRLLNQAKINCPTIVPLSGMFSCKQISLVDQSLWRDISVSTLISPSHSQNLS